ncbi:WG repeat-containing protein [Paenibacillus polymyxa]|uniref:WG repeat-containing protein n=1 Tax=Paenibacillus polymyxa TaxID=1406 RepID=UPI00211D55B4|nr:WG repeat-containing protein [Paenibacillus polymyxa]
MRIRKFATFLALAFVIGCANNNGVAIAGTTKSAEKSQNAAPTHISQTSINFKLVAPESDGQFHDGLLFSENADGTLMYFDSKGNKAFSLPDYITPSSDFYDQRAVVKSKKNNLYGYIDTKGNLTIPFQYEEAGTFSEGIAYVKAPGSSNVKLIDRAGKTISSVNNKYASDYIFKNHLALVYAPKGNKIGYINTSGNLVVPLKYTFGRGFSEGLAVIQSDKGLYGYVDAKGTEVIPTQYKRALDFSEGLAAVQNDKGKWGFIDKRGKAIIPFKYTGADGFSEGLASVNNERGMVGYINKTGALVIGYQKYNSAFKFKEGIALVGIESGSNGKFGYIDHKGKLLTKLEYKKESSSFNNGYAVAIKTSGNAFILKKI